MASAQPVAVLFVVLLLPACVDTGSSVSETADTTLSPVVDDDQGSVRGVLTDESLQPVVGAQALLKESGQTGVSDDQGVFVINGVLPGSYQLFVGALGYESLARKIDVTAGAVTEVSFTLQPIPVVEPFDTLQIFRGFFGCSWRVVIATGPCFFPGPDINPTLFPQQNRAFNYNVFPHWRTLIGELDWQQTSLATGSTLSMTLSYQNRTTRHWWSNVEGLPVLTQRCQRTADDYEGCNGRSQLPDGEPEEIPENGTYTRQFINTGNAAIAGQTPPMGMAFQQTFTLYVSIFYHEGAPENHSAVPSK